MSAPCPRHPVRGLKGPALIVFLGLLAAAPAFAGSDFGRDIDLVVDGHGRQTIGDWGMTLPELGILDGHAEPLAPGHLKRFCRQMGVSSVRVCTSGSYLYAEETQAFDAKAAEAAIGAYLDLAASVRHYTLCVFAPPKAMKLYFSESPEMEYNLNTLRGGREDDYVNLIIQALGFIQKRSGGLPEAISIAVTPDTVFSTERCLYQRYYGFGCSYEPGQWMRVAAKTRRAMDAAGVKHTGTARSAAEAAKPDLLRVRGVTVAQLSYTFGFNGTF